MCIYTLHDLFLRAECSISVNGNQDLMCDESLDHAAVDDYDHILLPCMGFCKVGACV